MEHSEQQRRTDSTVGAIGRATVLIVVLGLMDKALALAKEMILAARFGVGQQIDAFNIAYAFPGIVNLLFNGACVAAFVPMYAAWQERANPARTRDNALSVLYPSVIFFIALTVLCYACAPWILRIIGYGFGEDTMTLAVHLERLIVWLILIEGIGVTHAALLQSWKRFGQLTVTQALINTGIIVFLAAGKSLGIEALVYGFLAGTVLKVAAMLACSRDTGLAPFSRFTFRPDALRGYARLAAPLLGSALIANSNILIDQSMSTSLPTGGVAILRYAYRVNDLPLQIIVIALSKAIFPFISEQAAGKDTAGLRAVFRQSLVFIALVSVPITCYVLIFAEDIVDILLRRGAFDAQAAGMTALTLRCYSLGLVFQAYAFINGSFFSALQQGIVLLRLGVLTLGLNFGFNWLFLKTIGGPHAIALSTAVTMGIIASIFFWILLRELGKEAITGMGKPLGLIPVAALAACAVCYPLRRLVLDHGLHPWAELGIMSVLFCAVYAGAVLALKQGELALLMEQFLPKSLRGQSAVSRRGGRS